MTKSQLIPLAPASWFLLFYNPWGTIASILFRRRYSKSMLHLNILQLPFFLSLCHWSNALPPTLGAVIIDSSLSAAPSGSLNASLPVCVDNKRHSKWGLTLDMFGTASCRHAMNLIIAKVESDVYTSYDFYSRLAFPGGHEGWPLVQGSGTG